MRVCVVGLGKMGLPLAALYASRGLEVVGCDCNPLTVEAVNRGECPLANEPGIPELVADAVAAGGLEATLDTTSAVATADTVVIIVPLMVDAQQAMEYSGFDAAIEAVARGLRQSTLVSIETTVPVGDTRNRFGRLLERVSGLRMGEQFYLAFSPERVQSTRVLRDLRAYPKIVGGINAESTSRAVAFYERALGVPVLALSSSEAAELTKLAESVYRDVNIALANQLAMFAEQVDVDIAEVISAANSEPLSHLHRPGLGVGGHCIPVYPYFLLHQSSGLSLVALARGVNDGMPGHAVEMLGQALGGLDTRTILILGVAYRANVKEMSHSPALALTGELERRGVRVLVHDPLFAPAELRECGLEPADLDNLPQVDGVIVHSYHAQYHGLDLTHLLGCRVVLDGANVLDPTDFEAAGVRYLRVGLPGAGRARETTIRHLAPR